MSGGADDARFHPSRDAVARLLLAAAMLAYLALTVVLLALVEPIGGAASWLAQVVVVAGASFAAMMLVPQGRARAWLRLQTAKHLFRHRYDYRLTWLKLTRALAADAERPLRTRIETALAALVDAPAALLFVPDPHGALVPAGPAPWPAHAGTIPPPLAASLGRAARILDGDAIRAPAASVAATADERRAAPDWLRADPSVWAGVPLVHGDRLTGLILLARPALDRSLDWEDYDLLSAAGRQVASHLAEAEGQAALSEARRFHEFNRRFAFIVHDVKNLASGLGLLARNAERHADNPAFRADMVVTLRESVGRLNDLLARLSPQASGRADPPVAADPRAVLHAVAERIGAEHPVRLTGACDLLALTDPVRLGQALDHLVRNAVEATRPADDPVHLAVAARGAEIAITIRDCGRGMTADFVRDELFAPFQSTKPGGFGIGAYEARALVLALGGRIEVESRPGAGTTFTLLLPAAAPARLSA